MYHQKNINRKCAVLTDSTLQLGLYKHKVVVNVQMNGNRQQDFQHLLRID